MHKPSFSKMRSNVFVLLLGVLGWMMGMSNADKYTVSGTTSCTKMNNVTCVEWSYDIQMEQKSSCFGGDTWVHSRHGSIRMKDLQPGTEVLVYKSGEFVYDVVYTFLHVDSRPIVRTMYQICTKVDCITISYDHILFVGQELEPTMVLDVKVGQVLYTLNHTSTQTGVFLPIVSIQKFSSRDGIYAPATYSGTIVVNGIVASVYATTTWHSGAHVSMIPIRMYHSIRTMFGYTYYPRKEGVHTFPMVLHTLFGRMFSTGELPTLENETYVTNSSEVSRAKTLSTATTTATTTTTTSSSSNNQRRIETQLLMVMLNWPHVF